MKARIKTTSLRQLLCANLTEIHSEQIKEICKYHGVSVIETNDMKTPLAVLLGEVSSLESDCEKYPDTESECVLFAGINQAELNNILNDFKIKGIYIPLKAIYTPFNRSWSLRHLVNELTEEHKRMTGGVSNA